MRPALVTALLATAALSQAQSLHFGLAPDCVPFTAVTSGYAPFSAVTGVSILRTQSAFDAFWTANNGHPGLRGGIAPWKPDFEQGQLLAIVLPKEMRFDAIPAVTRIVQSSCWRWSIEIAPSPGTLSRGAGFQVPYVVVRTPFGPSGLDVTVRGPDGQIVSTIRVGR